MLDFIYEAKGEEMLKNIIKAGAVSLVLSMLMLQSANADDVTETISEALESYKDGEYSDSVESLNYAIQVIQQKKADALSKFLPNALDGWSVKDKKRQSGGGMFGGGISSTRQYKKDSSSITVTIAADSPAMQSMMMILSNPMFAGSSGGEMMKIKRQKAMVTYNEGRKKGDIKIVVKKRFFVTVEGRQVSREELVAYAEGINYKKLAKMP